MQTRLNSWTGRERPFMLGAYKSEQFTSDKAGEFKYVVKSFKNEMLKLCTQTMLDIWLLISFCVFVCFLQKSKK